MTQSFANALAADNAAANESEIRFRTLFEQAPFSVQLLSSDGRTLQVNRAWEILWQVQGNDELKRYVLSEYNVLTDPQLQAKGITPYLLRAFAGESVAIPAIAYDPAELGVTGRLRWVGAQAHPIKDAQGCVREVMLIHEDVTERMQAENALRASEMRLKQLANTIPQLAWMADAQGWVHWYNERWYDYTGASPAEIEGWGWKSLIDPEALPQVVARWQHSLTSGEPFQMTFNLRAKDGTFRPFFTLVAPLKDDAGKVVQWFGTNTDVSALAIAEEGLAAAEERLRLATDAGNIGIWEWDIDHDRVIWSDRVYRLHELPLGSFGGRVADFSALVHPDDREAVWQKIEAALANHDGFSAEFRALLPDGGVKWLSTWARMHRDQHAAGKRMIGAAISIDDYKRAEAALKESDKRKDDFLAMLAHELRNPLAPIATAAQLIRLAAGDAARVRQAGDIIARQVRHMTELVDDLLDVSRVTRGLVELDKQDLDLKSVVAAAIEQVRPLIEARHHVLTTWTDAEHLCVHGDKTRLVQVVSNLLTNAAKYTPPSGEIALRVEACGERVTIRVKDNGIGIDARLLPHVFEIFTQAERTPDRSQGGLGLGLALVKSIKELHGGQVHARSDGPGKGSEFMLSLPLVAARADEAACAPDDAPVQAGKPVRVMIVDDNLDAAQSLASLLEARGHQVSVEVDGTSALAAAREAAAKAKVPQVCILDIGLPDMNGCTLALRLRELPGAGEATFIALTGYGQAHDRALSKAAGFDHHLVKPVDPTRLEQILRQAGANG